jgi:choline kinase
MPTTADAPKCFAEVSGRRLIDWAVDAFAQNGLTDICFIGGYRIDRMQSEYPQFTYRHNVNWKTITSPPRSSAPRIRWTTASSVVTATSSSPPTSSAAWPLQRRLQRLGVDSSWLTRYEGRTDHPPDDAEKVTAANGRVTRVHRQILEIEAHGEYIGVAKFSAAGAARLRDHYHRCRREFAGQSWREAAIFEKAYLILLFQEMIERGESFTHIDTPGGYIEVDQQDDYAATLAHPPQDK